MPKIKPTSSSSKTDSELSSAIQESMAAFASVDLDSERGVILKDWSAQDFANIYVQFRPQLISHARRFLSEEGLAEEAVQDAFLYLMTALPELDSELGVLRFLKWKTKMLCLDIIRASQAGLNSNLVPLDSDFPDEAQPIDSLVRADDAAIIHLALAKLNPRHREALIATMYEEKSHEEAAQQMGVGENAFRQLLFRARASFRQALVGEAAIEGKSVAEILAVAARKAASSRNTVLVALLVMSTFAIAPILNDATQVAQPGQVILAEPKFPDQIAPVPSRSNPYSAEVLPPEVAPSEEQVVGEEEDYSGLTGSLVDDDVSASSTVDSESEPSQANLEEIETTLARAAFNEALSENVVLEMASQALRVRESNGQLIATNQSGLQVNFAVDLNSQQVVQFVFIEFESAGKVWKAVPGNSLSVVEDVDGQTLVSYAATDFLVGDFSGEFDYISTSESVFSRSGIKLELVLDGRGGILTSHVALVPKI